MSGATAYGEVWEDEITVFRRLPQVGATVTVYDAVFNRKNSDDYTVEILWIGRPTNYEGEFIYRRDDGRAFRRTYWLPQPRPQRREQDD